MARLDDLTPTTVVRGVLPDGPVTVVAAKWYGTNAVELTYKDPAGKLGSEILHRDRKPTLQIVTVGRPHSFDSSKADFDLLRFAALNAASGVIDRGDAHSMTIGSI